MNWRLSHFETDKDCPIESYFVNMHDLRMCFEQFFATSMTNCNIETSFTADIDLKAILALLYHVGIVPNLVKDFREGSEDL